MFPAVNPLGWALLGALLAGRAVLADDGEVIDRSVALVAGQVLTLSDLEFEARVALISAGGTQAAFEPLERATLRDALELVIGHRLAALEAERLLAHSIEEFEVQRALRSFRARFLSDADYQAFLRRHEADEESLGLVLARSLRAVRYLDAKLRLKVQVSEADVREYQQEHGGEQGATDEDRARVREMLRMERMKKLMKEELERLRRLHGVRRLGPFSSSAHKETHRALRRDVPVARDTGAEPAR